MPEYEYVKDHRGRYVLQEKPAGESVPQADPEEREDVREFRSLVDVRPPDPAPPVLRHEAAHVPTHTLQPTKKQKRPARARASVEPAESDETPQVTEGASPPEGERAVDTAEAPESPPEARQGSGEGSGPDLSALASLASNTGAQKPPPPPPAPNPLVCPECGHVSKTKSGTGLHMRAKHPDKE